MWRFLLYHQETSLLPLYMFLYADSYFPVVESNLHSQEFVFLSSCFQHFSKTLFNFFYYLISNRRLFVANYHLHISKLCIDCLQCQRLQRISHRCSVCNLFLFKFLHMVCAIEGLIVRIHMTLYPAARTILLFRYGKLQIF